MGNRFANASSDNDSKSHLIPSFFKTLELKWFEHSFKVIAEGISPTKFAINNSVSNVKDACLSWKLYFKTFSDIKGIIEQDKVVYERSHWHPAVLGYVMAKADPADEIEPTVESISSKQSIEDDYTEDDASELSEHEDAELNVITNREESSNQNRKWNSKIVNPIFFGYTNKSIVQHDMETKRVTEELRAQEKRAIETAKNTRIKNLDELEKLAKGKAATRLSKMAELENKYESSKLKRLEEYNRTKKEIPPTAFRSYHVSLKFFVY